MNLVQLARRTLERIPNASLATVLPDGRPWNSPLYVAFDAQLSFYWSSHLDALHSKNIAARPDILLVVFDSTALDQNGHGVYLRGTAQELNDGAAIDKALACLATRKQEAPKPSADFVDPHPRRVYEAVIETAWTNVVSKANGHYFDERVVIDLR
jgi:hypothetical protein